MSGHIGVGWTVESWLHMELKFILAGARMMVFTDIDESHVSYRSSIQFPSIVVGFLTQVILDHNTNFPTTSHLTNVIGVFLRHALATLAFDSQPQGML